MKRKDVERKFERFVESIGGRVAADALDEGGYLLDYQPIYGGFVIHLISSKSGAVQLPFGSCRHKARAMFDILDFAEKTASIKGKE